MTGLPSSRYVIILSAHHIGHNNHDTWIAPTVDWKSSWRLTTRLGGVASSGYDGCVRGWHLPRSFRENEAVRLKVDLVELSFAEKAMEVR
jgi:hypothetical protein